MFTSVKALTAHMDETINYYKDGVASKDKHDIETYNKWLDYITNQLNGQLKKLKSISSNKNVISKYESIINELLK